MDRSHSVSNPSRGCGSCTGSRGGQTPVQVYLQAATGQDSDSEASHEGLPQVRDGVWHYTHPMPSLTWKGEQAQQSAQACETQNPPSPWAILQDSGGQSGVGEAGNGGTGASANCTRSPVYAEAVPGDRLACPWTGLGYGSLLILLEFPPDGHQNGGPMPPWCLHSGVAPQLSIKSDGEPAH